MTTMAVAKSQRLRTLENHIRKCAEAVQKNGLDIGRDLIEIRDDELWRDEFDSWNQYLKERAAELVGKSFVQSAHLLRSAEIDKRIPDSIRSTVLNGEDLPHTAVDALGKLAPNKGGNPKHRDYSRLDKRAVARVIKDATVIAKGEGKDAPTVRDIRKAVDKELGIDREAERKKKQREAEQQRQSVREQSERENELSRVIARLIATLEDHQRQFNAVPPEGWDWLEENKPSLCQTLANACSELADFMRS